MLFSIQRLRTMQCNANAADSIGIALHWNIASLFDWLLLCNKMRNNLRRIRHSKKVSRLENYTRILRKKNTIMFLLSFPESMKFFSSVTLYSIKGFVLNESLTMFFHLWIAVGTSGLTFQTPFVAPLTNSTWIPRLSGTFLFSQKKTSPVNWGDDHVGSCV